MKMKMKVIKKPEYVGNPNDRNVINRHRQADLPNAAKRKNNHNKKQAAIVATWFSPQKYAGFKSNFK